MKKLFMTIVLAFSLLLSIPAFSMDTSKETAIATNTSMNDALTANNATNGHNNTTRAYATSGNRTNWGWLGLLGLFGLAGLRNRSRDPQK
ncbi:WGxxGxxG-CTERM domain-containing protein [Paenibacillus sp. GYB004]|uniref:WGxxGxxG family protein n=1 Tax=Paenibacillus sp. GYB004 TaxID=2994393 RepID=UPI002F967B25